MRGVECIWDLEHCQNSKSKKTLHIPSPHKTNLEWWWYSAGCRCTKCIKTCSLVVTSRLAFNNKMTSTLYILTDLSQVVTSQCLLDPAGTLKGSLLCRTITATVKLKRSKNWVTNWKGYIYSSMFLTVLNCITWKQWACVLPHILDCCHFC